MADFDLKQIAASVNFESYVTGTPKNGGWNGRGNVYCPLHSHNFRTPSLTIYRDTKTWKCWSCGKKGDVIDWIGYSEFGDEYLKGSNFQNETYKLQILKIVAILTGKEPHREPAKGKTEHLLPPDVEPKELWVTPDHYLDWADVLWYYKDARIERVRQWLYARGVRKEWGMNLRIGWTGECKDLQWYEQNRISLCWFAGGKLVGVRLRADPFGRVDEDHKYGSITGSSFKNYLYNQDCCFNSSPYRLLTESEIDVAALCSKLDEDCAVGKPASDFNSIHAANLIGKQVYALNDSDAAGMKQNERVAQVLKRAVIGSLPEGCKDVGQAMQLGASISVIENLLKQLKQKAAKAK